MIKIFRKIRQKLLKENKIGRYLLYALGEIILVVIGIFIALQLNTQQENRKNAETEKTYLKGILNNLNEDINDLNGLLVEDTIQFDAYTLLLRAFTDDSINIYSSPFLRAISIAHGIHAFEGNSIVFEDMKSSGKINFIKSDDLRFSILEYYNSSIKIIHFQNEQTNPLISDLQTSAFTTNVDLNSLIEKYMFPEFWSAEIDQLDLSFFEKDTDSEVVKDFANKLSLMKASTLRNHFTNFDLLVKAKSMKGVIEDYLSGKPVIIGETMTNEITAAIKNSRVDILEKNIDPASLNTCFVFEGGSTYNYLAISVKSASFPAFKYFVDKGADIENVCRNKSPLMYAAKYGQLEMLQYLLEKGADINASVEGKTALDFAKNHKNRKCVKYLEEHTQ